jgi:cobalamin biosynthesis protein CobT
MKKHLTQQICELWDKSIAESLSEETNTSKKQDAKDSKPKKADTDAGKNDDDDTDKDEDEDEDTENEGDENTKQKDTNTETSTEVEKQGNETMSGLSSEQKADLFTQWLFDVSLLRYCIGNTEDASSNLFQKLEDQFYQHSKLDGTAARQRISKSASDFWQRTSLLFGLLA